MPLSFEFLYNYVSYNDNLITIYAMFIKSWVCLVLLLWSCNSAFEQGNLDFFIIIPGIEGTNDF